MRDTTPVLGAGPRTGVLHHCRSQPTDRNIAIASPLPHLTVSVDTMTDDNEPTADELDQLAQSLAIDGSLGRADTLRVVEVLRALAAARRGGQTA